MDDLYAVEAKKFGSLTAPKYITQIQESKEEQRISDSSHDPRKITEDFLSGKRIAKVCIISLISIGIAELVVSSLAGSAVTFANGMNSLSYALISIIVFIGLYSASSPADGKFHFGYHKVESFAVLMTAIGMLIMGSIVSYHSLQSLISPHAIKQPVVTMIILSLAASIFFYNTFQMRTIGNKYNLLSLKTYSRKSIEGGSVSILSLLCVAIATQLGFSYLDAIGSVVIAGYIFYIAYISLKRSFLNLIDAWEHPKVIDKIRQLVEEDKDFRKTIKVNSILIRPAGLTGAYAEIHIRIEGSMPLTEVELLCLQIELAIRSKISIIKRVTIIPHAGFAPVTAKIMV